MRKLFFLFLGISLLVSACEPFNLEKKKFTECGKPLATIGASVFGLQVDFSLENVKGDIGAVGWTMGDGRSRSGQRFSYIYERPGTYTVTVVIANECDDSFTATKTVTVGN